ncbi:hypothetical protein OGATHE_004889, partial [Ogataea polymorpha]
GVLKYVVLEDDFVDLDGLLVSKFEEDVKEVLKDFESDGENELFDSL